MFLPSFRRTGEDELVPGVSWTGRSKIPDISLFRESTLYESHGCRLRSVSAESAREREANERQLDESGLEVFDNGVLGDSLV